MLGISSSWRSEIADSGVEIIDAILKLGMDTIELEYRITMPMLREILPLLKKRRLRVASLHNFFPLPEGLPRDKASGDLFALSSPDKEERDLAVKYSIKTLEWAQELEAVAIVLHLGKVAMGHPMDTLKKLYDEKKIDTGEGKAILDKLLNIRSQMSQVHLDSALRSLEKLVHEADKRNILLGLENRYNIQDFPDFNEFAIILKEFSGSPIRYWHDIGHATVQENLGIVKQIQFLENFSPYLIGLHLHGCKGYNDHYAPGSGEENYSLIKNFLKPETISIIETHHRATQEELLQGIDMLYTLGFR